MAMGLQLRSNELSGNISPQICQLERKEKKNSQKKNNNNNKKPMKFSPHITSSLASPLT